MQERIKDRKIEQIMFEVEEWKRIKSISRSSLLASSPSLLQSLLFLISSLSALCAKMGGKKNAIGSDRDLYLKTSAFKRIGLQLGLSGPGGSLWTRPVSG